MIELYLSGKSMKEVSLIFLTSPTTIHHHLSKNNVKRRAQGYQMGHKFYCGGEKGWFKKGQTTWNKGMKRSDWISEEKEIERRKKISITLKKSYAKNERRNYFKISTYSNNKYKHLNLKKQLTEHKYVCITQSEWGFVPKGFHIHHINGNKNDNNINNLSCIPSDIHRKLHIHIGDLIGINSTD
jgi:hypothetical protein